MFRDCMFVRTGASPMVVVLGGNNDCRLATPYFSMAQLCKYALDRHLITEFFVDLNRIFYNFFSAEILESVTTFWPNTIFKL